jgi:heme/copper-type cytochrome/quinol oxidase subunit 2
MDRSKLWILEGAAIGIAVILAVIFIFRGEKVNLESANSPTAVPVGNSTLEETKYSAEVPKNSKPTDAVSVAPAAPNSSASLGKYNLVATENGYEPSVLTVKEGDFVQINFSASGDSYDFSMPYSGLYQSVKNGESKDISFQLTSSGTFIFECRDLCPKSGKIEGKVIVLPK